MKVPLQNGGEIDFIDFPQRIHPERLYAADAVSGYSKVLDVGCGVNKTVPLAVGVDIRPVADIESSADDLSFIEDNSYDCVIARHILEHLIDPVVAIEEWMRVVRPGGKIVFVLPDHSKIDTMSHVISYDTHVHVYTPDSLRNILDLFDGLHILELEIVIENWSFGCIVNVH